MDTKIIPSPTAASSLWSGAGGGPSTTLPLVS